MVFIFSNNDDTWSLHQPAIPVDQLYCLVYPQTDTTQTTVLSFRLSISCNLQVVIPVVLPVGCSLDEQVQVSNLGYTVLQRARACFPETFRKSDLYEDDASEVTLTDRSLNAFQERLSVPLVHLWAPRVVHGAQSLLEETTFDQAFQNAIKTWETQLPSTQCLSFIVGSLPKAMDAQPTQFSVTYTAPMAHATTLAFPVARYPGFGTSFYQESGLGEDVDAQLALSKMDHRLYSLNTQRLTGEHGAGKSPEETIDDMRRRHASGTFVETVPPLMDVSDLFKDHPNPPAGGVEWIRQRRVVGTFNVERDITVMLEGS